MTRCTTNAGFTLLEMLIVIAILGLVGTIAIPALLRPSDRLQLQASTRDIVNALRLTRAAAIARSTPMTLVIDLDKGALESPVVPARTFVKGLEARLKIAEPERVSPSRGGFRFFADGSSTGGEISLALKGLTAKVCVHWLTGQAREC